MGYYTSSSKRTVFYQKEKRRVRYIHFGCEMNEATVSGLLSRISSGPKAVVICSPGGEFEYFNKMAPAFINNRFTAIGHDVRSAAVVLHLLGTERLAFPESRFAFHEVRMIFSSGEIALCDAKAYHERFREEMAEHGVEAMGEIVRLLEQAQAWFLRFVSDRTGLSALRFQDLMRREAVLSAHEAMRYGLVHKIVSRDELLAR